MKNSRFLLSVTLLVFILAAGLQLKGETGQWPLRQDREIQRLADKDDDEPAKPTSHTNRTIEGWTVRVDDRLLHAPNDALGARASAFWKPSSSTSKQSCPRRP